MEEAFKCNLCTEEFNCLGELSFHVERHHERVIEKKFFKCNVCGYEFRKLHYLMDHTRTHTGERPFKCKVSFCEIAFKQESNLKRHIRLKHSDERPFKCDSSGSLYTAKTSSILAAHKKMHSDERPFACPHSGCSFSAKRNYRLSQHTANVHSESKAFTCSKCYFKTNCAKKLASHFMVHEGRNENIPCSTEGCQYKGKHSRALNKHMWRHKTLLQCPVLGCGRYAPTKNDLKDHIKLHNSLNRAFQCPLCFKHFLTMDQLQQHCIVHTNEKPFQCGHCKYAAARQTRVKRHISSLHADIEFPFIVHLLDDRECLRCKVVLPMAQFVVHCKGHVERLSIIT